MESMSTTFLIDSNGTLAGLVGGQIAMAKPETPLLAPPGALVRRGPMPREGICGTLRQVQSAHSL